MTISLTLAAAGSDTAGLGWLPVVAVIVGAAVYLLECCLWPFAACRHCKGAGRFWAPGGRAWRNCRACGGSGRRVRLGRRAWTYITHGRRGRR